MNILHVSPRGDDKAAGSAREPLATLARAFELAPAAGAKKILLAPGTYRLAKTLTLSKRHSGISVESSGRGKAVVSGTRSITGWREENDGLWSAPVPWANSREKSFRQLFVNGSERPRAVFPKSGYLDTAPNPCPPGEDGAKWLYNHPRDKFEVSGLGLDPSWDYSSSEIVVYLLWLDIHLAPTAVRANGDNAVVELGYPSRHNPGGQLCRLENSRSIATEPGEWALDWRRRRIFYRPRKGEKIGSIAAEAPFVETLLEIDGAEDVSFRGVLFTGARYDLPWGNRSDAQSSYDVSPAISLRQARRCIFEKCTVADVDGYAIYMRDGTRDCVVDRCRLVRLGAGGVRLGCDIIGWRNREKKSGTPDGACSVCDPRIRVSGNTVSNCEIGDYGRFFKSACGVLITHAEHSHVVHNEIHDGYYTGVSCGWVWGYAPSVSFHNEISFNHIHDIGKGLLSDMGAIYTLGLSTGTVVRNNVIHDIDARDYGGWGLYNDEGSTGILLENNVVYRTKFACYHMHYGRDCIVRNNIFGGGRLDQVARTRPEKHISFMFYNNIVFWTEGALFSGKWDDKEDYELFTPPIGIPAIRRRTTECDWNLYFSPNTRRKDARFGPGLTLDEWRRRGEDVHSVWANPKFANPEAGDFSLAPDSPAFKLGFKPIDVSAAGPKGL